jgi:soluble lytic murein transglycosylase-like protein
VSPQPKRGLRFAVTLIALSTSAAQAAPRAPSVLASVTFPASNQSSTTANAMPNSVIVTPSLAPAIARWRPLIMAAAARFAIPADWIADVMRAESAGLALFGGRPITSSKGAMGLMQLMPATWQQMRRSYRLGSDPYDPEDNIIAGAAYLRAIYDRFGYPGMFGAYNAGPARYGAYSEGRRALPDETSVYLGKMITAAPTGGPGIVIQPPQRVLIFAIDAASGVSPARSRQLASSLFAIQPQSTDH